MHVHQKTFNMLKLKPGIINDYISDWKSIGAYNSNL